MSEFQTRRANLHLSHGLDYQIEGRPVCAETVLKSTLTTNEKTSGTRVENTLPRFVWNYVNRKAKPARKPDISFEKFQSLKKSQVALRVTNFTHSPAYLEERPDSEVVLPEMCRYEDETDSSTTQELNQTYCEHFELGSSLSNVPNSQLVSELRRIRTSKEHELSQSGDSRQLEMPSNNHIFPFNNPSLSNNTEQWSGGNSGDGHFGFMVRNKTNYVLTKDQWRPVKLTPQEHIDCTAKHMEMQLKYQQVQTEEEIPIQMTEKLRIVPQNSRYLNSPVNRPSKPPSIHVYMPKVEAIVDPASVSDDELSNEESEVCSTYS